MLKYVNDLYNGGNVDMKFIKIVMICLMIIGLTACNKNINEKPDKKDKNQEEFTEYKRHSTPGEIIYITLEEMESKLKKKESFPIIFSTTYCLYCRDFHSVFDEYIKTHHVVMYEVILDKEDRSEQENLAIIKKYFPEFTTTPGVFYAEKGKEKNYLNFSISGMNETVIDEWVQKYKLDKK